jgi:hypothetical protein
LLGEFLAVKVTVNATDCKGMKRKQEWWLGLVNDGGTWKVGTVTLAKPVNMNYVEHKAANAGDGEASYRFSLKQFAEKVAKCKAGN